MKAINGIIKKATLHTEDYFLTCDLSLELAGGYVTVFGGYCLYNKATSTHNEGNYAGEFICKILEVVGVNTFQSLEGRPIRVIVENDTISGTCIGIQNFLDFRRIFIPNKEKAQSKEVKQLMED